jgi:hypothetical protein
MPVKYRVTAAAGSLGRLAGTGSICGRRSAQAKAFSPVRNVKPVFAPCRATFIHPHGKVDRYRGQLESAKNGHPRRNRPANNIKIWVQKKQPSPEKAREPRQITAPVWVFWVTWLHGVAPLNSFRNRGCDLALARAAGGSVWKA